MDLVEKLPPEINEKISELRLGEDIASLYNNLREYIREAADPAAVRKNYHESHEFLSQQIGERSHQVWMLGSLFVPVSFLIFTSKRCGYCEGTGRRYRDQVCQICDGKGSLRIAPDAPKCGYCDGTGIEYRDTPCRICGGTGWATDLRKVKSK